MSATPSEVAQAIAETPQGEHRPAPRQLEARRQTIIIQPRKPSRGITDEQLTTACDLIATRHNLRDIADALDVWLPELWKELTSRFHEAYVRARELRALSHAEGIEQLMEDVATGAIEPDAGRVILDGSKWLAERMDGRRWGQQKTEAEQAKPPSATLESVAAQLASMEGATGLFARMGIKIEQTSTSVTVVADQSAQLPDSKG